MSLESWRVEFAPVFSSAAVDSDLAAAQHSLQQWLGLRAASLQRHGVKVSQYLGVVPENADAQYTGPAYMLRASTCALCVRHRSKCRVCPLAKHLGGRCDVSNKTSGESPWHSFVRAHDPEPMIAALQPLVSKLEAEYQKELL